MSPDTAVAHQPSGPALPAKHTTQTQVTTTSVDGADHDGGNDNLQIAQSFVHKLDNAFSSANINQIASLFMEEGWFKDILGLQWDYRAQKGPKAIAHFLSEEVKLSPQHTAKKFILEPASVTAMDAYPGVPWLMGFFRFETDIGRGRGVFRLAQDGTADPKIHTLFFGLEELKGHEEKQGASRSRGVEHGEHRGGLNWQDRRERKQEFLDEDPAVVIVGAGQSGLMLAYRLQQLNVPTLIIDKNERIGDNWRKRYRSLVLHDPVWYDHYPGMPYPPNWPIYTPKDKLAAWMEHYAEAMELNAWMGSSLTHTSYDEAAGQWTLKIKRSNGQERTVKPKHCVLATGHSGEPNRPRFKGEEQFKGPIVHSSEYVSGDAYQGKKAIVVGSNNSGQDLSVNLVEHNWDVTQVQRSETYVMSTDSVEKILLAGLYSEDGPPTEDADLIFNSVPNYVHVPHQKKVAEQIAEFDRDMLAGLRKAGFKVGMGVDGAGFLMSYYQKGGGYYLATSAEELIIDGRIKMKQGQEIDHFTTDGIAFAEGAEIKADLVVLATGYGNMKQSAINVFGKEGEKMNPVWGLDKEGELNTVWRPSGHPGLWAQAGNLALNRWHSKKLALNIKARLEGIAH